VLRNNYLQTLALSLTEARGAGATPGLRYLMQTLEAQGRLDRSVEFLPERRRAGRAREARRGADAAGTRGAARLCQARLHDALLESAVPDDPISAASSSGTSRRRCASVMPPGRASTQLGHRLRREIIADAIPSLANSIDQSRRAVRRAIHFGADSIFGLSALASAAASAVPATDDYERLARQRAVETLTDAQAGLTREIAAGKFSPDALNAWQAERAGATSSAARATVSGHRHVGPLPPESSWWRPACWPICHPVGLAKSAGRRRPRTTTSGKPI
jgi:glutamate dehydrogenase